VTSSPFPSPALRHPARGYALVSLPRTGLVSPAMTRRSLPMSVNNDFRAASGLNRWPAAAEDPADATQRGPGLFEIVQADGERAITNVRRLAGLDRAPGSRVIAFATWLLVLLGGGLMYVSFQAQYTYIYAVKNVSVASAIEAAMLDAGMIILSALGIGLALAGKASKAERFLIMVCAGLSAFMNYAAADTASWRSVIAYVAAPVFLAVIVDRVISVIRRHVLPLDAESAWVPLGRATIAAARLAALVLLYLLRFVLAPPSTGAGLRRVVLNAAPLPEPERRALPSADEAPRCGAWEQFKGVCGNPLPCPDHLAIEPPVTEPPELEGASKKARLAWWYERDRDYGNRAAVAAAAKRLAPKVDLSEGTARAYIGAILDGLDRAS
jgi:hypothetical protein